LAANSVTLVSDILRAARSIVRGIGGIRRTSARRIGEAHARADFAEFKRTSPVSAQDPELAVTIRDDIHMFLKEKADAGLIAYAFADPQTGNIVICLLPRSDASYVRELAAAALLSAAVRSEAESDKHELW